MAAHSPRKPSSRVSAGLAGPALVPLGHHAGKPGVPLTRPVTVIGSRSTARIHLISSTVSKAHALLVKSDGAMYLRDLASRSHVYINGEQVREADLNDGDEIKIGSFTFKYVAGPIRRHGTGTPPAAARLDVTGGDFPIPIDQRVMLIGRRSSDDVVLVEESVSTAHAVIFEMDGERYVRDLGSRTGTYVNGVSTHQHKLQPGDVIRCGETDIRYTAVAADAASLEVAGAGESATGYALEAPHDEIQAAPGDEHGDTIGGLDLVGEMVREELDRDKRRQRDHDEDRLEWRRPAHDAPAERITTADEIDERDETTAAAAAKDDVQTAQELEPLAPLAPAEHLGPPEPLAQEKVDRATAIAHKDEAAVPSAETEDLAAELLADEGEAAESLSGVAREAETTARVDAEPVEDAAEPAAEADEADLNVRRGWRSALADDEPAPAEAEAEAHQQRDESSALEEEEAEAPPVDAEADASKDADHDVFRFPDTTQAPAADESRDESGAPGTALLDQDALAGKPDDAHVAAFDFADSLAAAQAAEEPASLSAPDLKLDLGEAPAEPAAPPLESIDLSGIDLGLKAEAPAPVSDEHLESPAAADEAAPVMDFSVKEPPPETGASLAGIEDVPPPPVFKLSDDAEALAAATEALTKRGRRGRGAATDKPKAKRGRKKKLAEPVAEDTVPAEPVEAIEPFAFEEPQVDLPPLEQVEAPVEPLGTLDPPPSESPVEVLDATQPTVESALSFEQAPEDAGLDEPAGATAPVEELSDAKFEAAVEDFAGDTVGDLVEPDELATRRDVEEHAVPRAEAKPPAADPFAIGANQENFLGGVPLPRVPLHKPRPTPVGADPVDDLIAEIDTAAAAAERARVETTPPAVADDQADEYHDEQRAAATADVTAAPFVPVPPAVPRMPRRPRPIVKRGVEMAPLPAHVDESIPPFKGGDATSGIVTTAFDGLAMPPVRQADVFSQMSPPALADPDAPPASQQRPHHPPRGEDPREASGIMTPMDLVGLRREPSPAPGAPARRPRPVPGAYKVPGDSFFGGGAVEAQTRAAPVTPPGFPSPTRAPAPPSPGPLVDREEASRDETLATEADLDEGIPSPRRRLRPALPDTAFAEATQRRPAVIYADDDIEFDAAAQRRRYVRRAQVLTAVGLLVVVAAAVGTYMLVPVRALVEASITYKNLAERTKRDRDEFQDKQRRRLSEDHVRRAAMRNALQTPEVDPGFLEDTVQYARVIENAGWRESGNVWSLVIPYDGRQREQDRVRMMALATALWQDSEATLGSAHRSAKSQVERLRETIKGNEKRAQELAGEIAALRILYEKRPGGEQVKALEADLAKREDAWKKAVAAVKEAEAEVNRLKQGGQSSAAAAPAAAAPELKDDELAQMQRELADLQAKAEKNRDVSTEEARQAREQLAASLESLKREITTANAAFPGSPEMTAYIDSAQRLWETTREVVAEMVRRQEQQFNSIMELKSRLNEKMEARRSDMWRADEELQKLTELLAIRTRQYNAAVGGGMKKEAEELAREVEDTQAKVKARQDLIPVDPGYAEAIAQIEQFIDTTKKNIAEDRARTDDLLARLQKSFTSGPQIAKLPADQQELAKRLEEKLSAINAARQQYNQSLDAGAARATDEGLAQQIATLTAGIDARKKQLLDQRGDTRASADAVKQKQAELDRLKAEQSKAEESYFAASKELENARRAVADARSSFEKLERLESERSTLQTALKTQNDTLLDKQRELKEAVYPEQPTDADIRIRDGADRRVMYAAIAGGSLFLLFAGLVTMASLQAVRLGPGGASRAALAPADLQPIQHPRPQPTPNGNGNGQSDETVVSNNADIASPAVDADDDDDHAPAVV